MLAAGASEHPGVSLGALVLGPCWILVGLCFVGSYLVYGIQWVCIGVQITGP